MHLHRLGRPLTCCAVLAIAAVARADGEDLNVHNKTGHPVLAYLFQDDHVHVTPAGGVQFAHLGNGQSAVAHVPSCRFSVVLVDGADLWHAEFHDCHATEMTFLPDTGHVSGAGVPGGVTPPIAGPTPAPPTGAASPSRVAPPPSGTAVRRLVP